MVEKCSRSDLLPCGFSSGTCIPVGNTACGSLEASPASELEEFPSDIPEERKKLRKEKIKPIIDRFYLWCDQVDPRGVNKDFEKALTYARNQKESLCRFLEDGSIPAHNNRAENAIRPFVIGRKNWLFSQTPKGASASADMYSLVETAKANGLDVFEYLSWLFRQITAANHNLRMNSWKN